MSNTKPEFTTDACSSESAISLNGARLNNEQVLLLLQRGAVAERIVNEMWEAFYGQNLELANWHQNGDLEPIDKFFEQNEWVLDDD